MASDTTGHELRLPTKLAFGGGDLALNLVWNGTGLFLMYFYTDVLGIAPSTAGAIYALALTWDAVTDPVMGAIADRTRTRFGRYRPYIAAGAIPLGAGYALAFTDPGLTGHALVAWVVFTHCLLRTVYTVVGVPFSSLQARLTPDTHERGQLAGWRMLGAASGGLSIAFLTPQVVAALGPQHEGAAYQLAASVAGVACAVVLLLGSLVMREPRETALTEHRPSRSLRAALRAIAQNQPTLRVIAIIVLVSMSVTMFGKNTLYYFKYELGAPELAKFALVMPAAAMILLIPAWVGLARRTSKRTAWMVGCTIAATGFLAFALNPSRDPAVALWIIALISIGTSSFGVVFWAMLPDTVEWNEDACGERDEAMIFGLASFAQKAALGINALMLGLMLDWIGYSANQPQTEATLGGIRAIMSLVPLAGIVASMLVLRNYPIDARSHAELRTRIAARTSRTTTDARSGNT
jgi:GPH family glycoside/pentoside/hexuronide:cation symporter